MKLADYLKANGIKRTDFARSIGVSPQTITGWCEGTFGISSKRAQAVLDETKGEVTPNDFFDVEKASAE
jgi:3,4-dihydroxy 2-butanone 4-phosphate synthase/GTP cyclohydrolase II